MPFLGENGLTKDKHELMGEILEENAYKDKSTFEKSKIILSNASHLWEDIGHVVAGHGKEDNEFMRDMANKGSLDLAREHGIDMADVPKLRESVSQWELEDTLKDINRQAKDRREAGMITHNDTLWGTANVGATILADPLLLPMMALPIFAPARLGNNARIATGAIGEAVSMGAYLKATDYLEHKTTDTGNLLGNMMVGGFAGGAIVKGMDLWKSRQLRDGLVDEAIGQKLIGHTPEQAGALTTVGTIFGKEVKVSDSLVSLKGDLITQVKPLLQDIEGMRTRLKSALKGTGFEHVAEDILEIWKHKDVEKIIADTNHPMMKNLYEKMGYKPPKSTVQRALRDGEAIDTGIVKDVKQIDYIKPLDNLTSKEVDDLFSSKETKPHPISKFYEIEGVEADIIEEVLKRGEAVRKKGAKNSHITINADGSRTIDRLTQHEVEYYNSWLTPKRVERIRAGKATDKDLEHLVTDIEDMQTNPFLSTALTVGALTFLSTGEIKADDGGDGYSPLDLVLLAGMGVLAFRNRKGIADITGRIKTRVANVARAKNFLKFDSLSYEGFGIIGGTKFFHEGIKKLGKESILSSKMGTIMLDNLKSIMENSEGVIEQVSQLKNELRDTVVNKLYADVAKNIEDFKKETKFWSLNPVEHVRMRERFYESIGKAYTLGDFSELSKAQKEAVESFRTGFKKIYDHMKEAGVKGMESFKHDADYFPRYHNPTAYDFVAKLPKEERKKVSEWYANAIKRGFVQKYGKQITQEQADKMAKQLIQGGQSNNLLNVLKDEDIFKDIDLSDIDKQFGRTMFRIPIDFSVAGLSIGGKKLEMIDFVDTNAYSVMSRYLNQSAGHYAFAKHGIESVDEAIAGVKKEFQESGGNLKLRDAILDYANSIIGRPIVDNPNKAVMDMAGLLSKATSTQFLHLSGITTMSEVVPSIAHSLLTGTFGEGWKAFIKSTRTALEDIKVDSITDELLQLNGYGHKRVMSRESFKNPRVYTGEDFGMNSAGFKAMDRGLTAMQKVTFFMNQLPFFEDLANVLNIKNHHNQLMGHLKGEKVFNPRRAEGFGLNANREKVLKSLLGKISDKSLNIGKWTEEEQSAYKSVMTMMQRGKVGELGTGDLPLWIMKSPIAKTLTTLLSFPIQSFDNLLLRDLYARDGESILKFKAMLAGTAVSIMLKDVVGGSSKRRKRDDEDRRFMERTIYGLPHIGVISMASTLFNDKKTTLSSLFPTLSVLENALNTPRATMDVMLGQADKTDRKEILQLLSVPFAMQKILAGEPPKRGTLASGIEGLGATIGGLR